MKAIKKEAASVESIGFPCDFVTKAGLPFRIEGAICFKNQAQFHPLKYLHGLCYSISSRSGKIYSNSVVTSVEKDIDSTYLVSTPHATVRSKYVIVASHYPFINFPRFLLC